MEGRTSDAEALYKETLAAQEKAYGENSPRLLVILRQYASLLREMGRTAEAEPLEHRIQEIASQPRAQSSTNSVPPVGQTPSQPAP
jgi:hypothetical protein